MKKIFALAAAAALVFSVAAFADDSTAKKDDAKSDMKSKNSMMHTVTCDGPCHFSVSSQDKKEVIDIIMAHAKSHHPDMDISAKDVKGMIKTSEVPE